MSKLFRLALAILIATPLTASAQNAPATEAITLTGPGKFAGVFEVKTQATIAAVDPAARSVVLARKNGTQLTLVVGDTVKNFEQIKVGDRVVTRHTQAVVLEVKKGGAGIRERTVISDSGKAAPGSKPSAYEATRVNFVADVIKVDKKAQTLTLQGVERKVTLKVKDAEQLNAVEKGDQVEGVYADAVAIAVEPAPRKKPQAPQPQ